MKEQHTLIAFSLWNGSSKMARQQDASTFNACTAWARKQSLRVWRVLWSILHSHRQYEATLEQSDKAHLQKALRHWYRIYHIYTQQRHPHLDNSDTLAPIAAAVKEIVPKREESCVMSGI